MIRTTTIMYLSSQEDEVEEDRRHTHAKNEKERIATTAHTHFDEEEDEENVC